MCISIYLARNVYHVSFFSLQEKGKSDKFQAKPWLNLANLFVKHKYQSLMQYWHHTYWNTSYAEAP